MKKIKKCKTCNDDFAYSSIQDMHCQECKRNANIKQANKNWLEKPYKKKRSKAVTNNIAYAFFYPGTSNRE